MRCHEFQRRLADYLSSTLHECHRVEVDDHIRSCRACADEAEVFTEIWNIARAIPGDSPDSDAMRQRFEDTLESYRSKNAARDAASALPTAPRRIVRLLWPRRRALQFGLAVVVAMSVFALHRTSTMLAPESVSPPEHVKADAPGLVSMPGGGQKIAEHDPRQIETRPFPAPTSVGRSVRDSEASIEVSPPPRIEGRIAPQSPTGAPVTLRGASGQASRDRPPALPDPAPGRVNIPGQLYLDGQAPPAFRGEDMKVLLIPEGPGETEPVEAQPRSDGSFVLLNVPSGGRYRVRVSDVPAGGYLNAGVYGSANALTAPVEIGSDASLLQLQVSFQAGEVEALVLDGEQPVANASISLVPEVQGRSDLYRTGTSDRQGKVTFTNVPPGTYRVVVHEQPESATRIEVTRKARVVVKIQISEQWHKPAGAIQ